MTHKQADKEKAKLHRRAMRYGKGTIRGARQWLRKNYTGNSKACHVRQAYSIAGALLPAYELDACYSSIIRRDQQAARSDAK